MHIFMRRQSFVFNFRHIKVNLYECEYENLLKNIKEQDPNYWRDWIDPRCIIDVMVSSYITLQLLNDVGEILRGRRIIIQNKDWIFLSPTEWEIDNNQLSSDTITQYCQNAYKNNILPEESYQKLCRQLHIDKFIPEYVVKIENRYLFMCKDKYLGSLKTLDSISKN